MGKVMGQKTSGSGNIGQVMMLLRMARLLRILRLVRLVKNIPPLYTLVVGIIQAAQGMTWVLVLTAVLLYALALLGVKLIGHGLLLPEDGPEDVEAVFPSILDSMFVLFKAMNGDWGALEPLFHVMPSTKFVFFMYTVVSTWGILSILTAVVSENLIRATDSHRVEVEQEEQRVNDEEKEEQLRHLFEDVDQDGTGNLDKKEFHKMLADKEKRCKLMEISGLEDTALKDIFHFLSKCAPGSRIPVIKREDFIKGLKEEKRPVSERTMMRLERRIKDFESIIREIARPMLLEEKRTGTLPKDMIDFLEEEVPNEGHADN